MLFRSVFQERIKLEKNLQEIQNAARALSRGSGHSKFADYSKKILEEAAKGVQDADACAEEEFGWWVKEVGAVTHEMTLQHARQMLDDYFHGAPPFAEVKRRDAASWNSRSITHLANYPSPSLPMIFSDESSNLAQRRRDERFQIVEYFYIWKIFRSL